MSVLHKCWKAGECRKALISGDGVRFGLQCKAMGKQGKNFANRFAVDWSSCRCRGRLPVSLSVPSVPTSPMLTGCPRGERLGCKRV